MGGARAGRRGLTDGLGSGAVGPAHRRLGARGSWGMRAFEGAMTGARARSRPARRDKGPDVLRGGGGRAHGGAPDRWSWSGDLG